MTKNRITPPAIPASNVDSNKLNLKSMMENPSFDLDVKDGLGSIDSNYKDRSLISDKKVSTEANNIKIPDSKIPQHNNTRTSLQDFYKKYNYKNPFISIEVDEYTQLQEDTFIKNNNSNSNLAKIKCSKIKR